MSMGRWSVARHWKFGVFLILSETRFKRTAMNLLIILLSIVLVLNAAFLMLLILIQLPKKEAGAGLAFGAGATDALFGAGSGTVLTKITKYAAGAFFILAVVLSVMQSRYHHRTATEFEKQLEQAGKTIPTAIAPPPP